MHRRIMFALLISAMLVASLLGETGPAAAEGPQDPPTKPRHTRITQAQRQAAADRAAAARAAAPLQPLGPGALTAPVPGGTPDYFGIYPNYANSELPQLDGAGNVITGTGIRKFVDSLPGLGAANANNLGQYIPAANPDTVTYPGSDYYEIALRQYTETMHSDLPPTTLQGYVQLNNGTDTAGNNTVAPSPIHYLGPLIVAQKDRAVRIKFTNLLPTGSGGNLFIPVDTTVMGAGTGPNGGTETYTQNRATLHLHGGLTPWISDGTPHQWITPAGENTSYPEGVSVENVPDMPDPGPGSMTFFYSNQQSARLMFYHDHAYGITRLNVYAGEAAGYLLTDPMEQALVAAGIVPTDQIPLIIQDKTFVPNATQLAAQDPTWDSAQWGKEGDLWFPHVYMPAQNPYDLAGVNAMGRWHYGPWFWPPTTNIEHGPVPNPYYDPVNAPWEPAMMPGTPNPSIAPEAFMDTPVINGTAYPYLNVAPKAYRFRILNAANDRFWNLQLYPAKSNATMWNPDGTLNDANAGEVTTVPAVPNPAFPADWPTDGRDGGVPDPTKVGPSFIQIGSEGGFLPAPAVIANQPVGWNLDPTTFNMGNVDRYALLLGPAERADVIVDFSAFAGQTLILYNDAPAAFPALDPRYDYYTGHPDLTATGGAPSTQPGYGPNTRTIMQIRVAATPVAPAFNQTALDAAFASTATTPGVFAASQDPVPVGQFAYDSAYAQTFPRSWPEWGVSRIQDNSLSFRTVSGVTMTLPMQPKAIQDEMGEAFDQYGRMSAALGVEMPGTAAGMQNFILYGYIDPPIEVITDSITPLSPVLGDGTQIWKITHNGVDTHPVHFHLFNVQVINRVGWDGAIRLPDPNELGWKETVRVNPLEDTIVAMRPVAPKMRFGVPESVRPLDTTRPLGSTMGFRNADPVTGNPIQVINSLFNFGWEYVWHCHILGHEENDMMRPIVFRVGTTVPPVPSLTANTAGSTSAAARVNLNWTDDTPANLASTLGNPANEVGFRIERAAGTDPNAAFEAIATAPANQTTYADNSVASDTTYRYRVVAFNAAGNSTSNTVSVTTPVVTAGFQGQYFANMTLAGTPALTRNDPTINFSWAAGSPGAGIPVDKFSVRWIGNYDLTAGTYRFHTVADDGIRLFVDGTQVVNDWSDHPARERTGDIALTAGIHQIKVEYYENGWDATARAWWEVLTPPNAPTGLNATAASASQINLAWTDNSANEAGFRIERKTGPAGTYAPLSTVAASTTVYSDTTAAPTTTYWYRVFSYNTVGDSATFSEASATTPAAPAGFQGQYFSNMNLAGAPVLTRNDPTINFNWGAGSPAPGIPVDKFSVRWLGNYALTGAYRFHAIADDGVRVWVGGTLVVDDWSDHAPRERTGDIALAAGTHQVKVEYYENGWGAQVNVWWELLAPPNAPTGLNASAASASQINLAWTDNSANETGFRIERKTGPTGTYAPVGTVGPNVTSYPDTGLLPNTTYFYQVFAYNAAASSAASNEANATTSAIPAGFKGDYFANMTLAGIPTLTRNDAAIDFNWGAGAPAPGLPTDKFSVRWIGYYDLAAGTYRFHTLADDGIRLFVDGTQVVNDWSNHSAREKTGDIALAAGNHQIKVEYYDNGWDAAAQVWWEVLAPPNAPTGLAATATSFAQIDLAWTDNSANETGFRIERKIGLGGTYAPLATVGSNVVVYSDTTASPSTNYYYRVFAYNAAGDSTTFAQANTTTPAAPAGFQGEYFANMTLSGTPTMTRNDAAIDFNWGTAAPAPSLPADKFSVRWIGYYDLVAGTYRFHTFGDDGMRLFVDGTLVVNDWSHHSARERTGDIVLAAGVHQIKVEYYENGWDAVARAWWGTLP